MITPAHAPGFFLSDNLGRDDAVQSLSTSLCDLGGGDLEVKGGM